MTVTFLGTGTSQGIPVITCNCKVCTSTDRRDKRLRSSVLIRVDGSTLVIDTGPDFRYQMLRAQVQQLDAVLYTHEHKDHIAGLDDVRPFNFAQQGAVDIYGTYAVHQALKREFYYAFSDQKYPGVPQLHMHEITTAPFLVAGKVQVTPIQVMHFKMPVLGFRIGNFTYITDAKTIDEENIRRIKGSEIVVINALQRENHISHFTLEEAVDMALRIGAGTTYFTHISHRLGKHEEVSRELPDGVMLAYDGLQLEL